MEIKNRIHLLDTEVIHKIAAGEVVINPASVIKECIENSIDALASEITVSILEGGKSFIKITDNGSGILKADIPYAFKRSATSKIKDISSLNSIETLGFRGEALFSISSAAKVVLYTKVDEEKVGSRAEVIDGIIKKIEDYPSNRGTTLEISDLFYNMPARKKYLKENKKEALNAIDVVGKLALTNPNVSIRFINDGKEIFFTSGDGSLKNAVISVFGRGFFSRLIPIKYNDYPLKITGFILSPNFIDVHNEERVIIVNGRYVKSDAISKGINSVYREEFGNFSKEIGYVLNISIPYNMVDVNIHPSKVSISFRNETLIIMLISEAVKEALRKSINPSEPKISSLSGEKKLYSEEPAFNAVSEVLAEETKEYTFNNIYKPDNGINEAVNYSFIEKDITDADKKDKVKNNIIEEKSLIDKSLIKKIINMKYVGQIFYSYALFDGNDKMYIVDTHAAHERILYEEYLMKFNSETINSQILALPLILEFSPKQYQIIEENENTLINLGFAFDKFGKYEVIIREVPENLDIKDIEAFIYDFIDSLDSLNRNRKRAEALISLACHSAVRGNDIVGKDEVMILMERLYNADNPFTCPHGRPTIEKIDKSVFDKLFGRV